MIELNITIGKLASLKNVVDTKELELKNLQCSNLQLREQMLQAKIKSSKARLMSLKSLQESATAKDNATVRYITLRRRSLSLFSRVSKLVECVVIAAKKVAVPSSWAISPRLPLLNCLD